MMNTRLERRALHMRIRRLPQSQPSVLPPVVQSESLPPRLRARFEEVAIYFGTTMRALVGPGKRGPEVTMARKRLALDLRHKYSRSQIGRWLGINHTSVMYLIDISSELDRAARVIEIDVTAWDEWI